MKLLIAALFICLVSFNCEKGNAPTDVPTHDTVMDDRIYDTIPPIKPIDSALAHDAVAYNLVGVISTNEGDTLELVNEKGEHIKVSVIRPRRTSQPDLYKEIKWLEAEDDSITISKKYLFDRVMKYHEAGWHAGYFARVEEKYGTRNRHQIKTADSLIAVKYLENTFK